MRKSLFFLTALISLNLAFAQDLPSLEIDQSFQEQLLVHNISPSSTQVFCYQEQGFEPQGNNLDTKMRIASLTKLFTTLAVAKNFSLEKTFTTEFHYSETGDLHIKGGLDPYFEEEKVFFLIAALNDKGITKINKLSYDENFLFTDLAPGEHQAYNPLEVAQRLRLYFNTKTYSTTLKNLLQQTREFIAEENLNLILPELNMSVKSVQLRNSKALKNPMVFTHTSRPLKDILKAMNVMSKNWISQHLFNQIDHFNSTLETLGLDPKSFDIRNGSGLPLKPTSQERFDNLSTCRTVLKMMEILKQQIYELGYRLEDLLAVGSDMGTLDSRFLDNPELKQGIWAKTGTLRHTSTLGGFLNLENPLSFAILNHTTETSSARKFQDSFLTELLRFSPPVYAIDYQRKSIFPLEEKSFFD